MRDKQDLAVCETDDYTPRVPPRKKLRRSVDNDVDKSHLPAVCETDEHPVIRKSPAICETDEHFEVHAKKEIDKSSLDYVLRSGFAGGMAGSVAKTVIAPLDRVKILFQTSNPQFAKYSSQWTGVYHAAQDIRREFGITGLFRGHAATLLRIFPYAAIKFVAYEQFRAILIPNDSDEVPWRRFAAGSLAGVTTVFFTYPLEVVRVRLAFETRQRKVTIRSICREMFHERVHPLPRDGTSTSTINTTTRLSAPTVITTGLANFYRGFSPTIAGMLPYAGVSFLTYDWVTDLLSDPRISHYTMAHDALESDTRKTRPPLLAWAKLTAGGIAGMFSQTASYPLEVVRRRMQVSGAVGTGQSVGFWECAAEIARTKGVRGFYVGLTIGYIKVVPMVACSFYVYEKTKAALGI